jgi:16S rRNA (adenine1518-N6/adenine1519-N6)-dimethyltransferase
MKQSDLRALLEAYGLSPRQAFGQNFLVDPALLAAIPGDAGVQAGDRVLEVGPGAGALTTELLRVGAQVLAVEIDAGMYGLLQEQFADELQAGRLRLLHADVLASEERLHPEVEAWWSEGAPPRVVANLPYSISGPFLARLIGRPMLGACLLLQKEVAEKAASRTDAGPLPIRLGVHFHARMGRRVPAQVFWPRPRIDSAFLHLEPRAEAPTAEVDAALRRVLRAGFGQRRKRALRLLEQEWPESADVFRALGVAETARAEEISTATWLAAAEQLARHGDCV